MFEWHDKQYLGAAHGISAILQERTLTQMETDVSIAKLNIGNLCVKHSEIWEHVQMMPPHNSCIVPFHMPKLYQM